MAEDAISSTSRSVAKQCNLYIISHPELRKTEYDQDPEFRKVAVQKVGKKGYTALYELPDSSGVWRTWAHANSKIIGIDMSNLKKPLGGNFPGFWRVYIGVEGGKESKGYYTWQDKDGSVRDKFMVCTPVEGTRYIIAATTYLDEFTMPIKDMEARAKEQAVKTRNTIFAILAGTIILIGVIVSLYGHGLTGRIKSLTNTADRISVGELDAEIEIKSKDEIGDLAEAISRMQESIRLSIERLRRRR
jgi:methyl-accepting chemotaxis protein